jgi:hypothetical protein
MKRFLFSIILFFPCIAMYCQQDYPPCLNELITKTAALHKINSCEGGDKLLRVEQYSYKDTLLYKLVFEKKNVCPDYINTTVFFDANCQVKIQIHDGGKKYHHEVLPFWVNNKEIKYIKSIDCQKKTNSKAKPAI